MNRIQQVDRIAPINEQVEPEPGDYVVTLTEEELAEVEKLLSEKWGDEVRYIKKLVSERTKCFVSVATPGMGYVYRVTDDQSDGGGYSAIEFGDGTIRLYILSERNNPSSERIEEIELRNLTILSKDPTETVIECIANVKDFEANRVWPDVSVVFKID